MSAADATFRTLARRALLYRGGRKARRAAKRVDAQVRALAYAVHAHPEMLAPGGLIHLASKRAEPGTQMSRDAVVLAALAESVTPVER
jgi:hypothetical protein